MKNMKILLVDDEVEFVNTLSNRLGLRGIHTDVVHDGEEALAYIGNHKVDVMVLDLKMPIMGGMEVLRKLYKTHPNIQVVILTGHGTESSAKEARQLEAFDYLHKPVDIEVLVDRIRGAYRYKFEKAMSAATFAQAGEFDTAKEMAREGGPFKTIGDAFKNEAFKNDNNDKNDK